MDEYKSNSHKSRQNQNDDIPEKKVEKVVSGSVKSKKKNGLQKITNVFVPEDVDDVKSYIFEDIVVPAVKDIILDAWCKWNFERTIFYIIQNFVP